MNLFRLFSIIVWLYGTVQGLVWLFRGRITDAILLLCCAPILFIIYTVVHKIQLRQDERIEADMKKSEKEPGKVLFKD